MCLSVFAYGSCQKEIIIQPSVLNGAWEDARRNFGSENRIMSTFKYGTADVVELHSFVFFIKSGEGVLYTSDQAFIITNTESLTRSRVRISCYPQGGPSDNLYSYVFKVLDDKTIKFLLKESSSPLFPARLRKGGEVYP
jgi:hypothetical protein